jgi:hypothetical protein
MARVGVALCEVLDISCALTSSAVLWSVDADLSAVAADLGICRPA